jgi:serine/threonine-protein kinase
MARRLRSGTKLGSYHLITDLAEGGMGTVYLARGSGDIEQLFAIKVLHDHLSEEEDFVKMLQDEARLSAKVRHPNVVSVVDVGLDDGIHFVVQPYVEGCALRDLLSRNLHCRPPELIVAILVEVLDGLHAAHIATDDDERPLNLIHRDVSPENILVGIDGSARIIDFGIAKAEARLTHTRPGTRKGKYCYMSPEQITARDVDCRSDVFAAGILLYNALTAMNLFLGDTDAQTLQNILTRPIPTPSETGLEPPVELDDAILRALSRNPEARYESAAEFSEVLRDSAMSSPCLGSPRDVAKWVQESFTAELAKLREAVRRSVRGDGPDIVSKSNGG